MLVLLLGERAVEEIGMVALRRAGWIPCRWLGIVSVVEVCNEPGWGDVMVVEVGKEGADSSGMVVRGCGASCG